jgi:hypothetical protein
MSWKIFKAEFEYALFDWRTWLVALCVILGLFATGVLPL